MLKTLGGKVSLALLIGWFPINFLGVLVIARVDNWFLLSSTYVLLFGGAVPLLALAGLWSLVLCEKKDVKPLLLPVLASVAILLSGGLHFFIQYIAALSV